jgi:hypothetical protein
MATWIVVWLVVSLVTVVALAAVSVALVRHAIVIGRTAREAAEEVGPIAREVAAERARASERAARLQAPRPTGRARPRG